MKLTIINVPNLNLLGSRETDIYGNQDFETFLNSLRSKYSNINLEYYQSNVEGELINFIQDSRDSDGIIINAAGFTHTSVAIRDALSILKIPIIELHISNIYNREEFRQKSMISGVVKGGIFGLGTNGYILAINAMQELLKNGN